MVSSGTFYYITQQDRNPGTQLPYDPDKKTIVVLGSGWGATSLLKTMDTTDYNVVSTPLVGNFRGAKVIQVVISPKNFFLFTPLLPSVAVGTLTARSIMQPTRYVTRHKQREVTVIEAEARAVDVRTYFTPSCISVYLFEQPIKKTVTFTDDSEIQGTVSTKTIPYDYLVYAVGAEVQTFGIPGVQEKACFMKEIQDAEKVAGFPF